MTEQKIMTYTKPGYRLQLLKITDNMESPYYQMRLNRKIIGTRTSLEQACKMFATKANIEILQQEINFGKPESIYTPAKTKFLEYQKM